jgi:hypothetical protein
MGKGELGWGRKLKDEGGWARMGKKELRDERGS